MVFLMDGIVCYICMVRGVLMGMAFCGWWFAACVSAVSMIVIAVHVVLVLI